MTKARAITLAAILGLASTSSLGCGGGKAGDTVQRYVEHLRAGRFEQAHAMLSPERRAELDPQQLQRALASEALAHVQDISVRGVRSLSGTGTCLYTDLDFDDRKDQGPYGYYIFYLVEEGSRLRVQDVLTYSSISGDAVKTTDFDHSREPFPCHEKGF